MITPAQQKRIDAKLARQEQIRREEENQRLAEEKLRSEETQRQQAIVRFANNCLSLEDFQFSDDDIDSGKFTDYGGGYGVINFPCGEKPHVRFSDIQRMSKFLQTENIIITTDCKLVLGDDDSYKKVYTLCVEVGYI